MKAKFIFSILIIYLTTFYLACAPKQIPQTVAEPAYITHTVKHTGETLGLIATWYTGKSTNWQQIKDSNSGLNEKRINIGDDIRIPLDLVVKNDSMPKSFIPKNETPELIADTVHTQKINNSEVANNESLNDIQQTEITSPVELASQELLDDASRARLKPQQSLEQAVNQEQENENPLETDSNTELLEDLGDASQIDTDQNSAVANKITPEVEITQENSEAETVQSSEQETENSTRQPDPLWEAALDIKAKNKSSE